MSIIINKPVFFTRPAVTLEVNRWGIRYTKWAWSTVKGPKEPLWWKEVKGTGTQKPTEGAGWHPLKGKGTVAKRGGEQGNNFTGKKPDRH